MTTEILQKSDIPEFGTPLGGGFFTSVLRQNEQFFAVITAGIEGELRGEWGKYGEKIPGADSFTDGRANTRAMAAADLDIAKQALALRIGGHDDWAIPARDQQEPQYRAFKPTAHENYCGYLDGYNANSLPPGQIYTKESPAQTTAEDFKEGGKHAFTPGWYWSSTQYSAYSAFLQDFSDGDQYYDTKTGEARVRVVRMIPISD